MGFFAARRTTGSAHALVGAVLFSVAVGCDRAESDRNAAAPPEHVREHRSPPPGPTRAIQGAHSVTTPDKAPPCIVPMSDTPAPAAARAESCPVDPDGPPEMPKGRVSFVDAPGAPRIEVELAQTNAHRTHGLMYRTALDEDAGMLFSWPADAMRSFWMRNTCLPLDMLFISKDETIVGILEQVPTLNEDPRGVSCRAAHVLEVNAGYVRAHGVRPGQRVDIEN